MQEFRSLVNHVTKYPVLVILWLVISCSKEVGCFSMRYGNFPSSVSRDFLLSGEATIAQNALQITPNSSKTSGRILYKQKLRIWNEKRIASFTSIFTFQIKHVSGGAGEGLAFILTKDFHVPANSQGAWLGIISASATRNRSSDRNTVAIEFDTKKSFVQDIDSNHVGLDINSVYSNKSASLNKTGITLASGAPVYTRIEYDGRAKVITVVVNAKSGLSLSMPLDLRQCLPSEVYVGFSASTGSGVEAHKIISWYFIADDIDQEMSAMILIVVISVTVAAVLTFVAGGYLYQRKNRITKQMQDDLDEYPSLQGIDENLGPKKIRLEDLKVATGDFNPRNELGRGGFGIVYKGTWEDQDVAVKRITNTPLGKQNLIAEVTTIGSLHHKYLVELIGWCYERKELLLVYEYMPNGSLNKLLCIDQAKHGTKKEATNLSWERRHHIICGVAQALDYLHNECPKQVLHRDIKPSNILLDSEFNPRLGDFGLARMFKLSDRTHHSTVAGTPGYMAPEVLLTGRTTTKTDVFAFGVLILVIVCGRKPIIPDEDGAYSTSIIDWAWELYKTENIAEAIDPTLKDFDMEQAKCMFLLGLACCHPNPHMRPSVRNALQVLMGEAATPFVPVEKPVFMWPASFPSSNPEESISGGILSVSVLIMGGAVDQNHLRIIAQSLYWDRTMEIRVPISGSLIWLSLRNEKLRMVHFIAIAGGFE